jgi:hypothetical protein
MVSYLSTNYSGCKVPSRDKEFLAEAEKTGNTYTQSKDEKVTEQCHHRMSSGDLQINGNIRGTPGTQDSSPHPSESQC